MQITKHIHVLHADDDPEDRWIFREAALQADAGLKLTQFEDGSELIRYIEQFISHEKSILAIVCDMQMPLMGGLEVLETVRSNFAHHRMPILILSTSSLNRDIDSCMQLGATAFHSKPSTYNEYLSIVDTIIMACKERLEVKSGVTGS